MDNTREKLIELLQSAPSDIMGNHGVGALADHLIANGVTVQKWIPVTERLPEKSGEVLVYHTRWGVCRYYYHYSLRNTDWKPVTHWMPLPEPPNGE